MNLRSSICDISTDAQSRATTTFAFDNISAFSARKHGPRDNNLQMQMQQVIH